MTFLQLDCNDPELYNYGMPPQPFYTTIPTPIHYNHCCHCHIPFIHSNNNSDMVVIHQSEQTTFHSDVRPIPVVTAAIPEKKNKSQPKQDWIWHGEEQLIEVASTRKKKTRVYDDMMITLKRIE